MAREFRPEASNCYVSAEILQRGKRLEQPDADTGHAAGQNSAPPQRHQAPQAALGARQMPRQGAAEPDGMRTMPARIESCADQARITLALAPSAMNTVDKPN